MVRGIDIDALRAKIDRMKTLTGRGGRYLRLTRDTTPLRFLPGTDAWDPLESGIVHWVSEGDVRVKVVCLRMADQPCPICEAVDRWSISDSKADRARADAWGGRLTTLANVLEVDVDPNTPKILTVPQSVVEGIRNFIAVQKVDTVTPLDKGTIIHVVRQKVGTGPRGVRYSVVPGQPYPVDEAVMQRAHNLRAELQPLSPAELEDLLAEKFGRTNVLGGALSAPRAAPAVAPPQAQPQATAITPPPQVQPQATTTFTPPAPGGGLDPTAVPKDLDEVPF